MKDIWLEIYNKHHDALLKNLTTRTGDQSEAEDILSSLFLKLMETFPNGIENIQNIGGYLQTSATNLFIDKYRRETKHRDKRTDDVGMDQLDWTSNQNLEEDSLTNIELGRLRSAINRLPAEFRDVLQLLSEGDSYEQIASKLNIEVGTVKSRISRAKKKLGR